MWCCSHHACSLLRGHSLKLPAHVSLQQLRLCWDSGPPEPQTSACSTLPVCVCVVRFAVLAVCDAQGRCTCWTNSTATQPPACYSLTIYQCPGGNKLVAGAEPTGQCSVPRAGSSPAPSPSPKPPVASPTPSTPPPVPPPSPAPGGGLTPSPRECAALLFLS